MAKEAKPAEEGTAPAPKKSKKLLIIIAAALVVILLLGGAGAFFLLKPKPEAAAGKAAEKGVSLTDEQLRRAVLDSIRAIMLIRAFRIRGHLHADLDPLRLREVPDDGELDPATYGFTAADLDRPIFIDNVLGLQIASIRQIVDLMTRTYCGT